MSELCTSLESGRFETPPASNKCPQRPSIVDPLFVKVRGPQSTCTSAKVDNTSQPPQTKAVDTYQRERLHRAKPSPAKRRKHTCPICRSPGHHARTCPNVLLDEHGARADVFFQQLVETKKAESYVSSLASREPYPFVQRVVRRIEEQRTALGQHSLQNK